MAGKRLERSKGVLLLGVICGVFASTALVWLYLNRIPPNWDDAWYLAKSLAAYDALTHDGIIGYVKTLDSAFPSRAPLIAVLPTPFYLVFGRHWHAAYLVNIAAMLLLFAAVYDMGRRWWSTRAGLLAVLVVATMPLLYGLATWYMVDYALTAVVAFAIWLLIESDGMERQAIVLLFGATCGAGLLLKASFGVFIVFPFLYIWMKSRRRGRAIFLASIPCLIVALPWYAFHLRSTVEFALAAGYGKAGAVYGTGGIFSLAAIGTYVSNVVRDGISGYYAVLSIVLAAWTMWRSRHLSQNASQALPLFWLLSFPIYLFGQNKDVRLIAPILPAFALLLGFMLDSAFPRRSTGTALACALLAFPLLELYSVSFGVPFNIADMRYARRFQRDKWRHDEILSTLWANTHFGPGEKQQVLVGTDLATLNVNNLYLTAVAHQLPFDVETTAQEEDFRKLAVKLEQASFFVYKDGGEAELPAFNPHFERLVQQVRNDRQFSEIAPGWPWPNGGVVRIFKNLAIHSRPLVRTYLSSGVEQHADWKIAFGETLALTGLSILRTPDSLEVKYRWHCVKPPDREYKCFTHVLGPEGKMIGQLDHYLLDGEPAMRSWKTNDDALEEMRFRIPLESAAKAIQLKIGLFDPVSGERLQIGIPQGLATSRFSLVDEGTALLSEPVR